MLELDQAPYLKAQLSFFLNSRKYLSFVTLRLEPKFRPVVLKTAKAQARLWLDNVMLDTITINKLTCN